MHGPVLEHHRSPYGPDWTVESRPRPPAPEETGGLVPALSLPPNLGLFSEWLPGTQRCGFGVSGLTLDTWRKAGLRCLRGSNIFALSDDASYCHSPLVTPYPSPLPFWKTPDGEGLLPDLSA